MTWNFRQNHTSNKTEIKLNDTNSDLFRHTVYLYKVNLTELQFGLYTLEVKNTIGVSLTTFHVVPEGKIFIFLFELFEFRSYTITSLDHNPIFL